MEIAQVNSSHSCHGMKVDAEEDDVGTWLSYYVKWGKKKIKIKTCCGLNIYPQNSYIAALTPEGDGIRRRGLWRCLSHQGGALMNGISALVNGAPRGIPCPFRQVRTQCQGTGGEPGSGSSLDGDRRLLHLGLPASGAVSSK